VCYAVQTDAAKALGADEAVSVEALGFEELMEAEGKRREAAMAAHQATFFAFRLVQASCNTLTLYL
jgi:hypothetical protein